MPQLTLSYDPAIGPIFICGLSRPASALRTGQAAAPVTHVRFLIDTGASHTCIDPAVAGRLNLPSLDPVGVRSTTEEIMVNRYLVDLLIPIGDPGYHMPDQAISEMRLGSPVFDGLFGRDLLRFAILHINGVMGTFTLSF